MPYKSFEVRIKPGPRRTLTAEVLESQHGRPDEPYIPPFTAKQIEQIPADFARIRSGTASKGDFTAEEIGEKLFSSLFTGEVGVAFAHSLAPQQGDRNGGLRIRLSFDLDDARVRSLAALPWELLRSATQRDFLSLVRQTPVVRYLPVPRPDLLPFEGPLRILGVMSTPSDLPSLDLDKEWQGITAKLQDDSRFEVSLLEHASLMSLQDKLLAETWHVIHFMGHGGFQEATGLGYLAFESASGTAETVSGKTLGVFLKSFPDLRLVFLNACKTGVIPRRAGQDPYTATAAALVLAGAPAVIAMQASISDDAAIQFSTRFYQSIANRDEVDVAAVNGRLAIVAGQIYDWATPVLFTRVADGQILGPAVSRDRGSAPTVRKERDTSPLRLGIRSFSDDPGSILWTQELNDECKKVLDLRDLFNGRFIKDPASWQTVIVPRLRDFVAEAATSRRPLVLNFAAHASIAYAAGYFMEAKSGLDVTIRQPTKGRGIVEWRASAEATPEGRLFLPEEDLAGSADAQDVAVALAATKKVMDDVQLYLSRAGLPVHRTLPLTISPAPTVTAVRDGLHALQLAEVIDTKIRERTVEERQGVLHLFASAPNALLFFLGQLARGLGKVQLYEYDFASGAPGAYTPSILLPPAGGKAV
jgi:hypothetical protein